MPSLVGFAGFDFGFGGDLIVWAAKRVTVSLATMSSLGPDFTGARFGVVTFFGEGVGVIAAAAWGTIPDE